MFATKLSLPSAAGCAGWWLAREVSGWVGVGSVAWDAAPRQHVTPQQSGSLRSAVLCHLAAMVLSPSPS